MNVFYRKLHFTQLFGKVNQFKDNDKNMNLGETSTLVTHAIFLGQITIKPIKTLLKII